MPAGLRATLRRRAVSATRAVATVSLTAIETRLTRSYATAPPCACLVVGPPRSGTTLLYELLVRRFQLAYVTNLADALPTATVTMTRVARRATRRWRLALGGFENRFGQIRGLAAPNEGGNFWNQWIPETDHLDESDAGHLPVDEIRGKISAISGILAAPFLNKNVMHSVHIRLLDSLLPGCLFLHIERDTTENARSIVRYRRHVSSTSRQLLEWRSVKPNGWTQHASAEPAAQAVAQVLLTHAHIDRDVARIGSERRLRISYRRLCERPLDVLEEVDAFLTSHRYLLRNRLPVPRTFEPAVSTPLSQPEEHALAEALEKLGVRG